MDDRSLLEAIYEKLQAIEAKLGTEQDYISGDLEKKAGENLDLLRDQLRESLVAHKPEGTVDFETGKPVEIVPCKFCATITGEHSYNCPNDPKWTGKNNPT